MTTYGARWLTLVVMTAVVTLGTVGCSDDRCGGGGGIFGASVEEVAVALPTVSVTVWAEPDGAVVVEVNITFVGYCGGTPDSQSLYYVWNAGRQSPEQRALGPVQGSRRLSPTTQGGGTLTYQDAAPGLTIRVSGRARGSDITFTGAGGSGASGSTLSCTGYEVGSLTCR